MFKIDGVEFNGEYCLVDGITETFTLLEGLPSARLQSNSMWYDIIGTEISHAVTLRRGNCNIEKWEQLWNILRSPTASHSFEFPDGVDGVIQYQGHITTGSRILNFIDGTAKANWGDYTVIITPISPQI
ncbi:MAG: hypothetical protein KBT27_13265 [Prevotellaceae bacterium]|nr:hypothetical protein [Candidatus Faecinaster equi]